MALHNDDPDIDRLDKLARRVLAEAIKFERSNSSADGQKLCLEVIAYREAMVEELIGTEPTPGG